MPNPDHSAGPKAADDILAAINRFCLQTLSLDASHLSSSVASKAERALHRPGEVQLEGRLRGIRVAREAGADDGQVLLHRPRDAPRPRER